MKVKFLATFHSVSTKRDGTQVLQFKAPHSVLGETIKILMQMQRSLTVGCKLDDETRHILGKFTFGGLKIDRDGESTLKLESDVESTALPASVLKSMVNSNVTLVIRSNED